MKNKPELLSPVGDKDSLKAAVANGADAIYLGGKSFNARKGAANFSLEELEKAIEYAKIRGVRVYITANILYKPREIKKVLKFIEKIYNYGADGLIVQDLGLAKLLKKNFPDFELHASTQMTVHNLAGAKYLEELGFSRVVLARELSIAETKEIVEGSDLEVESFVHGALCISYSGQCLMSSLIGGRSGNRGRCAQPCRMPYTLIDYDSKESIAPELAKKYLLSPRDINTLEILGQLIEAGITSFKIEGRMKRAEYVALVTSKYRKYIDNFLEYRGEYEINDKDYEELLQIFNRGEFTVGHYKKLSNLELINYKRPKNQGLKLGRVINYNHHNKRSKIRLDQEASIGDGLEIWTSKGDNVGFRVEESNLVSAKKIEVEINGGIKKGDAVYRTFSKELIETAAASYQSREEEIVEVFGRLEAKIGEKLELSIWKQSGEFVTAESDFIPEQAKNQPLTENEIREQIDRLGNTPYYFTELEFDLDDNLFIPISKVNELRRKAINKLNQKRTPTNQNKRLKRETLNLAKNNTNHSEKLVVYLKEREYLKDVVKLGVDRVYLDYTTEFDLIANEIQIAKTNKVEYFIKFPRIAKEAELKKIKDNLSRLEDLEITGYLISQLGIAQLLEKSQKKLIADYSLHNFNQYTAKHWEDENYYSIILSPELNLKEINRMTAYNQIRTEAIIYGHLPMMITEYCPIGAIDQYLDNDCQNSCQEKNFGLLDRKGMIAPIKSEENNCRTIIYNSQPLYLLNKLEKIKESKISTYRLDFILETKAEIIEIIKAYKSHLFADGSNYLAKEVLELKKRGYTTGHFYRGVK